MNISSILKPLKSKLKSSKKKQRARFNTSVDSCISNSSKNSSTLSDTLDISQYLEYEWFDLEPKTDYTYSRSVSYNNVKGGKAYVSPNMSRRRIHGDSNLLGKKESPKKMIANPHWLRSREKMPDFSMDKESDGSIIEYLSENSHNEHLENNKNSSVKNYSSVIHQGQSHNKNFQHDSSSTKTITKITNTLTEIYEDSHGQVEKGIKEANASKAAHESQAQSSSTTTASAAVSTSTAPAASTGFREITRETVTTDYLIKDRSADVYGSNSVQCDEADHLGSHYRQQSSSSYRTGSRSGSVGFDRNEFQSTVSRNNSSGYDTQLSNTSRKRFLSQKMASAAAMLWSAGQYFNKDKTTTIQNMYGLDSDTEFDYDDVCGKSDTARASMSEKYSESSHYYTGAKRSGGTTATASNDGFIVGTAKGAKRFCIKTINTVTETVQWLTRATAHNVTSLVTSRRLCCCCLPILLLLLLLPLLLSGLWAIADRSDKSFFQRKSEMIFLESHSSDSQLALEKQVQLLISQMQETKLLISQMQETGGKQNEQLSRADVASMIKAMSAEQLTIFMGNLKQNDLKQNEHLESWKKEHLTHFEAVNEKLKFLMTNVESMNTDFLSSLKSQNAVSDENENKIKLLEESLQTFIVELSEMRNLQNEYYNLFKNCCKNATTIHSNIKQEVYSALLKVLGGNVDENNGVAESVVQQTLMTWLHGNYISRSELDSQLSVLTTSIIEKFQEMMAKEKINSTVNLSGVNSGISELFVRSLVDEALVKFNADKTGMADFALESGGGSVISTRCSETFTKTSARISIFGLPLYYKSNSPRTVIQADVNAGECWPFKGSIGTLVIKLSHKIKITAFSMEHIPKSISPFGHIESAPKDFSVYSLSGPDDHKGVCLGNYTYKDNGRPIQQFITQVNNANPTQYVELRISSNHGSLEYTCLYRFRVHGVPYTP